MHSLKLIFKFLKYLKPYWLVQVTLFFIMIIGTISGLVSPYILKILIDKVFPNKDYVLLIKILIILFGMNILRITLSFISNYLFTRISNSILLDIRQDLFNHLLRVPISFYDKIKTGDIVSRLDSDVNTLQRLITTSILRFIQNFLTALVLTVILLWLNYKLFIVAIILLPIVLVNTLYFQPKIRKNTKAGREKNADLLSYYIERFENIKLIKSFNRYDYEDSKLNKHISEINRINIKGTLLSSTNGSISTFIVAFAPLFIFGWGGQQVMRGAMTIGALIAFIQYLNRLYSPLQELMSLYWDIVRSSVSIDRLFEFIDIKVDDHKYLVLDNTFVVKREFSAENNSEPLIKKGVAFRNIIFKYDQNIILDNLDIYFEAGKKYALVGYSGCGKSTIINLMLGFYHPVQGQILYDDQCIKDMHLSYLREKIAFISQDNYLYHDTINENIRYGNLLSTDDKIHQSADLSGIYEHIIQLPLGFNSLIGDKGTTLSGGQKQRIAIARAFLKKADIIIMDEATSALDSESERDIYNNLCKVFEKKTMIFISHRLSAIRDVDEIIFLDKGKVVEQGTHELLIKKKGYYWDLFKNQLEQ